MTRTWVYTTMDNDAPLAAIVGERIHQSTSLDAAPNTKPFIMYRKLSDVPGMRGDDGDRTRNNGYLIFVHDIPGDYLRIDQAMEELRRLFADVNDPNASIVRSIWVEVSDDLRDDDMGTIMKFARIQVIQGV